MIQQVSNIGKKRSIYRNDALLRYARTKDKSILPRFVSTYTVACLWTFLGLLLAGGLVTCLVHVPIYASGPAIVVESAAYGHISPDKFVMVAFLPADSLSHLRVGQDLFVNIDEKIDRLSRPIIAVEPEVSSPDKARRHFLLNGELALAITQPVAVAIAQLEPLPSGLPASSFAGSIYPVNVEVGSQRLISLLPLMDRVLRE